MSLYDRKWTLWAPAAPHILDYADDLHSGWDSRHHCGSYINCSHGKMLRNHLMYYWHLLELDPKPIEVNESFTIDINQL